MAAIYFLAGPQQVLITLVALASPEGGAGALRDPRALRRAYLAYLGRERDGAPVPERDSLFVTTDTVLGRELAKRFEIAPVHETGLARAAADPVRRAIALLDGVEPVLGQLLRLTTTEILCGADPQKTHSGTLPDRLGTLLINPRHDWTDGDTAEALVHELTHTLADLDDRRFGHYRDRDLLQDRRSWARTGILGRLQPFPFAFHSILVAAEIVALRSRLRPHGASSNLHGDDRRLQESASEAIAAMRAHELFERIASNRTSDLLLAAEETLEPASSPA